MPSDSLFSNKRSNQFDPAILIVEVQGFTATNSYPNYRCVTARTIAYVIISLSGQRTFLELLSNVVDRPVMIRRLP